MLPKRKTGLLLGLLITLLASTPTMAAERLVTMMKNQGCVCCERWASALRAAGFRVKTVEMADVTPRKNQLGVPLALRSCHTATIGGYVLEGHVPPDLIAKLLREKPAIAGLAAPGMPQSAPGMDAAGAHVPYQVMAFNQAGTTSVYAQR